MFRTNCHDILVGIDVASFPEGQGFKLYHMQIKRVQLFLDNNLIKDHKFYRQYCFRLQQLQSYFNFIFFGYSDVT